MQKFPRRWDKITCVNFLQRKIILNSIAYYYFNINKLTDKEYDELSRQLVELQKEVNILDTQYGYIFADFDGFTGFDLYDRLNVQDKEYLTKIARFSLKIPDIKTVRTNKSTTKKGKLF